MKNITLKRISGAIFLVLAIAFVAKFGKPAILKAYVETGIGNCQKLPVLCIVPETQTLNFQGNSKYLTLLLSYEFPEMKISAPKEFTVIKEGVIKVYYKKTKDRYSHSVIYLLYEKPDFFVNLFPQLKKSGIKDDNEFVTRTMYARLNDIKNITDMFFVIMKSIFTPGMGDQKNIRIVKFRSADKKGFIAYNLTALGNYFDINAFNNEGDFFKIYINDKNRLLDLDKVLAIISTLKKTK